MTCERDSSIIKNVRQYSGILVYGSDITKRDLIIDSILFALEINKHDIFCASHIKYDDALKSPNLLLSNCKIMIIHNVKSQDIIRFNLNKSPYLLLIGEIIPQNSKIRHFFEYHANLASINCYHDSSSSWLHNLIQDKLENQNTNAIEYIRTSSCNSSDALSMISKINLHGDAYSIHTIQAICKSHKINTIERTAFAILDCDYQNALTALHHINIMQIIRYLNGYFRKILKTHDTQQIDFDRFAQQNQIFFKNVHTFKKHCNVWRKHSIQALIHIIRIEELIKQRKSKTIIHKKIWKLMSMIRYENGG